MGEYKEKFIVVNIKHLDKFASTGEMSWNVVQRFLDNLEILCKLIPEVGKNRYYVCNQDEPYADKVIKTILKGEDEKYTL